MFLENFANDIRSYILKPVESEKDSIGQSKTSYGESRSILGIIVNLRKPKEIGSTFNVQISEYALYSDTEQFSKRGNLILDGTEEYRVITMRKVPGFNQEIECHIHYLEKID